MKTLTLASASLALAVSLFGMNAYSQTSANLTYAQFVESCKNPGTYGHQRPPQNIRVACKNVPKVWEPIEAGSISITESRNLSAELFSDKYHVILQNFVIAMPELVVACPRLREVVETASIEKSFTCEQVIADPRDLKEICIEAINEAIAQNPDIVESVPTGRTFKTCEGTVVQKP